MDRDVVVHHAGPANPASIVEIKRSGSAQDVADPTGAHQRSVAPPITRCPAPVRSATFGATNQHLISTSLAKFAGSATLQIPAERRIQPSQEELELQADLIGAVERWAAQPHVISLELDRVVAQVPRRAAASLPLPSTALMPSGITWETRPVSSTASVIM
jgi:hypothetical protein